MINEPFDPLAAGQQAKRLKDAAAELSLSGAVRRAVHASRRHVTQLASATGLPVRLLGEWLEGTADLTSSQLDLLAGELQIRVLEVA